MYVYIISKFCLFVGLSRDYSSLCRGLKYLPKVRDIILNYPNDFLIGWGKNIDLCLKKFHKNERHLSLVTHSFPKFSQNICLINTHILIYWNARCSCKLWKAIWFYCVFFLGILIHYWLVFMSKVLYLNQTFTDWVSN